MAEGYQDEPYSLKIAIFATITFSDLTWKRSGEGMYYAIVDTGITGKVLSATINGWRGLKDTDFVQPYIDGGRLAFMSNVNTFVNNAGCGMTVIYR